MRSNPGWFERKARDVRALAHYRTGQVLGRIAILARRRVASLAPGRLRRRLATFRNSPPAVAPVRASEAFLAYALHDSVSPPSRFDVWMSGAVTFLNHTRRFEGFPSWNDRGPESPSHLWRMNLHYHRFLVDAAASARRRPSEAPKILARAAGLLDDWATACLPGARDGWADAWNSYSVSSRVLNAWIAWLLLDGIAGGDAAGFRRKLEGLGASGAAFLERWLERDLGGNHLLRNAAALAAAGSWFRGAAGARWRDVGIGLLRRESDAQFLADGFHEERSPMYHALAFEELLVAVHSPGDLAISEREHLLGRIAAHRRALRSVLHPDGGIALFNDSAFDVAPLPEVLDRFASDCGAGGGGLAGDLTAAGYFRFAEGRHFLLFDAGALGPDHLPAHAHCDALSFEWTFEGRRVVTDTGVDRYDAGPERDFVRSTAAHATLQVEDREQAECFSSFRMGRRPRVEGGRTGPSSAEGRHDGFGRETVHRRTLEWYGARGLAWEDRVESGSGVAVTVRLPLAPGIGASVLPDGATVELPGAPIRFRSPEDGRVTLETGYACERFGSRERRSVLRWDGTLARGRAARFSLGPDGAGKGPP